MSSPIFSDIVDVDVDVDVENDDNEDYSEDNNMENLQLFEALFTNERVSTNKPFAS
jgi:hypothetical protein